MKQLYKQTEQMAINKLTFEDNSKLIDVESTLKMLLTTENLKPYQKEWVVKSYKNICNFRYQHS